MAQSDLQVAFGSKGVQNITYRGVSLEDQGAYPSDAFHIWHMKATDLKGNLVNMGQYGWGETNNGESWNPATQTETYSFGWGTIATQFVQSGNNLNVIVTETNFAGSGIIFDGAEVYPFALHFPVDPVGFYGDNQNVITTTGPGVSVADYGSGVVTSVIPNEAVTLYGGWKTDGTNTYTPLMTGTAPDGLASFLPRVDAPVQPGSSLTYTVSLRFTPEGTAADASDAYASFAATYPNQMTWTDRRIIGTAYLASSPAGSNITQPGGYPTNPRRYFNDPGVDVTTTSGLRSFQNRILTQAASNVTNTQLMGGQGVITWDIEGEQYPQSTSYVCSPDQVATVAPEMESTILDPTSSFFGQKLDDAYFKTMSSAGLKLGLCLRPQVYTPLPNDDASQVYLSSNAAIIANLENKARYANSRWGATIFYVDSTVDPTGGTLDPAIFQQLITDLPSLLFVPEESTPRYYAYSAPFYSFIFHTTVGTPASTYLYYPNAFGANLVNDVSASTLAAYVPQLTQAVAHGDILMGHADYFQANDPTLLAIYQAAGVGTTAPVQSTPSVSWPVPAAIPYGTSLSSAQLDATANVAGTFSYSPAAGTVPTAGTTVLTTTFTPSDTAHYRAVSASVTLAVAQAASRLSWSAPASIAAGTALSASQLNATANVSGTFTYTPSPGTVLSVGVNVLQVAFTPTDTADYSSAATTVNLTVNPASTTQSSPTIYFTQSPHVVYGTPLSANQLNATANVPGTFTYRPAAGTVFSAGRNYITAIFTPADPIAYKSAVSVASLFVSQAVPTLAWSTPSAIASGTPLSAAQLNATANIPGTFSYSPSAGSVLSAGTSTLQVTFTPTDSQDYTSQTATVPLTVNPAAALPVTNVAVLSPSAGTTVSGTIAVTASISLFLDPAGSYLIVDGQEVGTHRITAAPFLYSLDTTTLSNGPHTLQIWAHDIGNNTTISSAVTIIIAN